MPPSELFNTMFHVNSKEIDSNKKAQLEIFDLNDIDIWVLYLKKLNKQIIKKARNTI